MKSNCYSTQPRGLKEFFFGAPTLTQTPGRTRCSSAFAAEWGRPTPLIVVPTTYDKTPTSVFRDAGFSAVIWANYNDRSAITALQATCRQIFEEQSVAGIAEKVSPLKVFRLQNAAAPRKPKRKRPSAEKSRFAKLGVE